MNSPICHMPAHAHQQTYGHLSLFHYSETTNTDLTIPVTHPIGLQ